MIDLIALINFTDWTQTDPHYFYRRGALWGIVATTLFWKLAVPKIQEMYRSWKWSHTPQGERAFKKHFGEKDV